MFRWGVSLSELGFHRYDLSGALAHDADPEVRVLLVVFCQVSIELRPLLSIVEHQVDRPGASRTLVADVGDVAVGARTTQRPVADIAVHSQHIASVLQELVKTKL